MTGRVLLLGGTGEARRLAEALVADGVDVVSSLAGRTADPLLPPGEVRIGGFGGAEGLAALAARRTPVARGRRRHPPVRGRDHRQRRRGGAAAGVAAAAAAAAGLDARPGDDWRWVDSLEQAAAAVQDSRTSSSPPAAAAWTPSPG